MSAIKMIAIGRKLSNIYAERCLPVCRQYGINQTGFDILLFFANNPEYNTARDLCLVRGIKSGMASVAVESLIQNGYLQRVVDGADRRKNRLYLTDRATAVVRDGRRVQECFADILKTDITEEELAAFTAITDKIEKNMKLF